MNDKQLQKDILAELDWEPFVNPAHIGVSVDHGVVTLTGHVTSFAEKHAAAEAVRRVRGVRALVQDMHVQLTDPLWPDDADIATAAVARLSWRTGIPAEAIKVSVENGGVMLTGQVENHGQREIAAAEVRDIPGVRMVVNALTLRPAVVSPADVQQRIEAALRRNALIDAGQVAVMVADGVVTLTGTVHSLYEREAAAWATWSAPGTREVLNELAVAGD
ncbi:BON domain-containing protein [Nitrospirillum viridazoti]|uniref:Osmotically-inducible protein OsmY n=1 Tax=Nitrospirillum amazonense TaxID=28077 RepID=A0A560HMA7_9PROT|nr:BON domain-containing protein [Nitrospirillum amazonense]TWB47677.1 osmotically-inducible protein OsmY [Nitrospirillum amazonense]